jgi:hypothetical protein
MKNSISNHKKGDTWNGMELFIEDSVISTNGIETFVPMNLTGYSVSSKLKTSPTGSSFFEFKTSDNTITIPNPLTGIILFMPVKKLNLPAQQYMFDVELISPDGDVTTIYDQSNPFSWKILQDIT